MNAQTKEVQRQRKRMQREHARDPDAWVQEKQHEAAQQEKTRKANAAHRKRQRALNSEEV